MSLRLAIGATALVWLPFALLLAGTTLADALGCRVDASAVHPCPFLGFDLGDLLSFSFFMGFLLLGTAPLMILSLIGWGIWGARRAWGRGR